jgi:hypothetical protein
MARRLLMSWAQHSTQWNRNHNKALGFLLCANTAKRAGLSKMHTYRNGILRTRGAYILFRETKAICLRMGQAISLSSGVIQRPEGQLSVLFLAIVDAFDLWPGRVEPQLPVLKDFLAEIFRAIAERREYKEDEGWFR